MLPEQPKFEQRSSPTLVGAERQIALRPAPVLEEVPTLASYTWVLVRERWTVAGIAGVVLVTALAYLFLATPTYRAKVLLQIEAKARDIAGIQDQRRQPLETTPADTETEIIRSRTLLGSVVDSLGLDVAAEPRRFPLIGAAIARHYKEQAPAPAVLGLSRFAWGGERIAIRSLDVSEGLLDEPVILTALGEGRYRVEDELGAHLMNGEVGRLASGGSQRATIGLFVTELVARQGTQFNVTKRRRTTVLDELQEELSVNEKRRKSGILVLSLAGPDRARLTAILDELSAAYLRQNVERRSAEADEVLKLLESQLPVVRSNLEAAQSALRSFKASAGTVDLAVQTASELERAVALDRSLHELELQRVELRQQYTENHPALAALSEKARKVVEERAAIDARIRRLPQAEIDWARLQRDVKSSSDFYTMLLDRAKELRVVRSGAVGDVRVLDPASVPEEPESPRKLPVLIVAGLLGIMGGIAAAFAHRASDEGTDDPEEIEARTGLPVYAVILHSSLQSKVSRGRGWSRSRKLPVLAALDPKDTAIENLRSLRTSLRFAQVESGNNIVTIGGPCARVGKSFVCANLAHVLASAERRVLLVDCDLRRGRLHAHFGGTRTPGISEVITGSIMVEDAIRTTDNPHLDLLPTGSIPPNPAELLGTKAFEQLLGWASLHYGFVVVDTPPILAVTDSALVGRVSGVNLLVLRPGMHSHREIALAVKRFAQNGITIKGAVLNDVRSVYGRYGMGRYHHYEYPSLPSGR